MGSTWISNTPSADLVGSKHGEGAVYHYGHDRHKVSEVHGSSGIVGV
ncbi:MAG: hypothetical protein R6U43_06635 [Candidatus Krumholzibacteriales bacterium]